MMPDIALDSGSDGHGPWIGARFTANGIESYRRRSTRDGQLAKAEKSRSEWLSRKQQEAQVERDA